MKINHRARFITAISIPIYIIIKYKPLARENDYHCSGVKPPNHFFVKNTSGHLNNEYILLLFRFADQSLKVRL